MNVVEEYQNGEITNLEEVKHQLFINILLIVGVALCSGFFTFLMRQTIIVTSRLIEFDLKNEIYKLWKKNLVLSNFTKLPKDLIYNDLQSNIIKPAKKLKTWKSNSAKTGKIHDIIRELTPYISWKQTYEEKDVGKSFLEKYAIEF